MQLDAAAAIALRTQLCQPWKWMRRSQGLEGLKEGGSQAAAAGPGCRGKERWVRLRGMGVERGRDWGRRADVMDAARVALLLLLMMMMMAMAMAMALIVIGEASWWAGAKGMMKGTCA